ncbi:MAG: hypothetical protein H0X66_16195 [Verrucomicrobia bacterium]|nr:hypothetical protein [Verrucomicrobiota bacterium]
MKLHGTEKISGQQSLRVKGGIDLRKRAELTGIPVFAWRMAAAQKLSILETTEMTVRRRHD